MPIPEAAVTTAVVSERVRSMPGIVTNIAEDFDGGEEGGGGRGSQPREGAENGSAMPTSASELFPSFPQLRSLVLHVL